MTASNSAHRFDPSRDHAYLGDNLVMGSLVPQNAHVLLDIGCGEGGLARRLTEQRGLCIDGITWSDFEAKIAIGACRKVFQADVSKGLPTDAFGALYDCVICSHLLEHIAYPDALLRDIHSVLKPCGVLLVAIPNLFFWPDRTKLLFGRWEYESCGTFDYTHLRWYTHKSLPRLIQRFGFRLECFIGDGWVPLPALRFLVGDSIRQRINARFTQAFPGLFAKQLAYRFVRTPVLPVR